MPVTNHILPVSTLEWTSICLLITWPYHRTLRYFTLMPAQRLAAKWDKGTHEELQDELRHWTGLKQLELTFVSRASAIAAAGIIGIFSWNEMQTAYWLARSLFYFSLSLSLWAIVTSAQQASVTRILSAEGRPGWVCHSVQAVLRRKAGGAAHRTFAELNMLYVWQCPMMLMAYGWATLLLALTLHVCSPLIKRDNDNPRYVAIFYLSTGSVLFLNFVWASAWVFAQPAGPEDADSELASLKAWTPKDARSPQPSIRGWSSKATTFVRPSTGDSDELGFVPAKLTATKSFPGAYTRLT